MGRQPAAGLGERRGLAPDHLQVRPLRKPEVPAERQLQQLALAHRVGRRGDAASQQRVPEAAAEVVAVADEHVAEHHRGLVAGEAVHGRRAPPRVGAIEYVVVHERGHVHHLHHRGEGLRRLRLRVGRLGVEHGVEGEQHERGAEHLAAVPSDAADQMVHAVEVAVQFGIEAGPNPIQARPHLLQHADRGRGRIGGGVAACGES